MSSILSLKVKDTKRLAKSSIVPVIDNGNVVVLASSARPKPNSLCNIHDKASPSFIFYMRPRSLILLICNEGILYVDFVFIAKSFSGIELVISDKVFKSVG